MFAESPTVGEFMQIFENCCRERQLEFDRGLVQDLLKSYYEPRQIPLRGCQPRDLILQVRNFCRYTKTPQKMTKETLDFAVQNYFAVM